MGVDDNPATVLPRAIARMRQALEHDLLGSALGGNPAQDRSQPVRIDDDLILEEVRATIATIREAEALIGATPAGPPWLDEVISGQREVVAK